MRAFASMIFASAETIFGKGVWDGKICIGFGSAGRRGVKKVVSSASCCLHNRNEKDQGANEKINARSALVIPVE